jgi:hypothetical protein
MLAHSAVLCPGQTIGSVCIQAQLREKIGSSRVNKLTNSGGNGMDERINGECLREFRSLLFVACCLFWLDRIGSFHRLHNGFIICTTFQKFSSLAPVNTDTS